MIFAKATKNIEESTKTEEELEKEARINLKRRFGEFFPQLTISYVMGAEPREKRIAELEAQIEKLIDFVLSKTECCDFNLLKKYLFV